MALRALFFFELRCVHGKHFIASDTDTMDQNFWLIRAGGSFAFRVFQGYTLLKKILPKPLVVVT